MASQTMTDGSDSGGSTPTGNKSIVDQVIAFLQTPLGMGLAAGSLIAGFLFWRVI